MSFGSCTSREYLRIFLCGSVTSVPLCAFVVKKETPQKRKGKQGLVVCTWKFVNTVYML